MYDGDITAREKFGANWETSSDLWGEVNADGWGKGPDAWGEGVTRTLRLYGATDQEVSGAIYTATTAQGVTFAAGSVNTPEPTTPEPPTDPASPNPTTRSTPSRPGIQLPLTGGAVSAGSTTLDVPTATELIATGGSEAPAGSTVHLPLTGAARPVTLPLTGASSQAAILALAGFPAGSVLIAVGRRGRR